MSKKELHSSHIFMFPFRFDLNTKGIKYEFEFYKKFSIKERIPFDIVELEKRLNDTGWKYEKFSLNTEYDRKEKNDYMYNEYAYFYDYVRDSIYNLDNHDPISYYFDKQIDNGKYEIQIKNRDEPYILDIDGISLRLFKTGVGILSIELNNYTYLDLEDILNINDFGRRVYPQFIEEESTNKTKSSFLADSITITGMKEKESFKYIRGNDIKIGSHIMYLLGDAFSQDKLEKNKLYIQPSLDDRMFVISTYVNKALVQKMYKQKYLLDDDWYRYVYVDNGEKTIYSDPMQEELIKNNTYNRWLEGKWGDTLYGVSRYSFVTLSDSNFPTTHMKTLYFQMMHMLLATRASVLRFSDEVSAIASEPTLNIDRLSMTYRRYLTFYNRMYFKEVTHQEQGIELYNIALKEMKIEEHIEKLDSKFTKLHDFSNLQADKKIAKKMNTIAKVGAALLLPPLVMGLIGLESIKEYEAIKQFGFLAVLLSFPLGFFSVDYMTKEKNYE